MIIPHLPGVALIDQLMNETTSSTYLASIWLSAMLYEEMILPSEEQQQRESIHRQSSKNIFRFNDLIMQDLDLDPMRKGSYIGEVFGSYSPKDYKGTLGQIQSRRKLSEQEGWSVPLTPIATSF
jgi:hypothetical protein